MTLAAIDRPKVTPTLPDLHDRCRAVAGALNQARHALQDLHEAFGEAVTKAKVGEAYHQPVDAELLRIERHIGDAIKGIARANDTLDSDDQAQGKGGLV